MAGTKHGYVNEEYRVWQETSVDVGGRAFALATKPGVFAHGTVDPSARLLAQHVRASDGDVVVHMNCGNGLLGAALSRAGHAAGIVLTDRNVLAVEAATRTLAANGVGGARVVVGHGKQALPADFTCDVVAIRIPHEKLALQQLLHDAHAILKLNGFCYIAGATNEGAKSAASAMHQLFGNASTVVTDSGHRVVRAIKQSMEPGIDDARATPFIDADIFNEQSLELRGRVYTFSSRPGVFSWDHLDEATAILVEHMDVRAGDRILDLGCGYGVLGVVAATLAGGAHPVTLVDVDSEAVRSAARSAHAAGVVDARVLGSDVAAAVLDERFDLVVTNPPFHVGKSTDIEVPIQFIADAYAVLAPGGRLNLVANRTLPYEGAIKWLFKNITTVYDGRRFKVLSAVKQG
jgi:16S rRNA (guanine1207-N2)-methyltransferase